MRAFVEAAARDTFGLAPAIADLRQELAQAITRGSGENGGDG
jgi:NAD(P)H-hydrate repair Nnr-like enzyme with NAD(P)H-hydrate epimerase domain